METESHVRFCVFDFGNDPSTVTETLGTEPTKSWAKGDSYTNQPNSFRHFSKWEIQSSLSLSVEVEKHIESLLSFLELNPEIVQKAKKNFDAGIFCAVYYYNGCNQGFNLSKQIIERIAKLNLSIDFDLYFLGNDESKNEKN